MALDSNLLALAAFGRVYHGLNPEHSVAVAAKVLEIIGPDGDEEDALDAYDDVWAASLVADTISIAPSNPMYPLTRREIMLRECKTDSEKDAILSIPDEEFAEEPDRPKRYFDNNLVAQNKKKKRKRRVWDKEV